MFTYFVPLQEQWSKALLLANLIGKKLLLFLASKKALYDAKNILITLYSPNANKISKFMISSLMIIKEAHSMHANTTFLTLFYSVVFAFCTTLLTLCIDRVMLPKLFFIICLPLGPEDAGLLLFFNKPATTDRMKSRTSKRGEICTATWSLHAATVVICTQLKNSGQCHFFP